MELSDNVLGLILILLGIGLVVWFVNTDSGRVRYIKSCIECLNIAFDNASRYSGLRKGLFIILGIFSILRLGKATLIFTTSGYLIQGGVQAITGWSLLQWLAEKYDQCCAAEPPSVESKSHSRFN